MGKYHVYYQVMHTVIAIESIFGNTAWLHTVKNRLFDNRKQMVGSNWIFLCVCVCINRLKKNNSDIVSHRKNIEIEETQCDT